MDLVKCIGLAAAYVLIGFFAECLYSGDEYTDNFGVLLFFWPVVLAMFIFGAPFLAVYKLAMWIRKKFKKEK